MALRTSRICGKISVYWRVKLRTSAVEAAVYVWEEGQMSKKGEARGSKKGEARG
jgi:hypothetical protein